MQRYKIKVEQKDKGSRLDLFLFAIFNDKKLGLSRSYIQELIRGGKVSINDKDSLKPHYRLKGREVIGVGLEKKKSGAAQAEDIPLDILYEDDDLAVINKPCGLVVHPAPGNYEHTLVNALLYHFKKLSDVNAQRPGIVHRLDKDTSGIMVIAKNNFSHLALSRQFAKHDIKRQYLALVRGRMEFNEDIIEFSIGRHPYKRKSMSVGAAKNPRYALTRYRTLRRLDNASFLELEPFTGRTHQLRVHLAFIGHPVLGDTKYGKNNEFVRLALHANYLGFLHPRTKKFLEFSCAMPPEFKDYLAKNKT